jgi:hypothetical protein
MFTESQLRKNDIETLKRWLRFRLGGYVVAVKHITANSRVHRGVSCPVRPDTISRISYPPVNRVTALQRLNREGQPRFYCSAAAPAVFFELRAKQGDLIALSEWEVTEPLWMHNLGYHPGALRRIGAQEQHISMRHKLTHSIPNETRENEKLRRQVSETFTKDVRDGEEYRYKQSIAIIESMSEEVQLDFPDGDGEIPKHKKIAGTAYPAMRLRADADNLVFLPEFVDSSLRIRAVRYVRVEAADEAMASYTFLTIGFASMFSGDTIEWRADIGTEDMRRSRIEFENGHWVMRDGYNRIRDIH